MQRITSRPVSNGRNALRFMTCNCARRSFHWQNSECTFGKRFVTKLGRELADSFAVTNWNRMHPHERAVVRIQSWTFNRYTIDRVGSVQHHNLNVLTFAGAYCQIQRPNKSVVARADILQVNQEEIEILQHLARRLAMFAVQTVNRYPKSRMLVTSPFDHVVLSLAAIAVLRTKERVQLKQFPIFALENFGRVLQFRIDRRGMQERTHALAAQFAWPKVG